MPQFKKSNKSLSAFQWIASLGIPTHIAVAPLGLGAELDLDNDPEGSFHPVSSLTANGVDLTTIGLNNGRGFRISLLEKIVGNQQPPTLEIMTMTHGGGSGIPGKCIHLPLLGLLLVMLIMSCELEDGVTSGDQNKKFHQKISDLHLDEGESGAQSHNEPEGQETVADHASQSRF